MGGYLGLEIELLDDGVIEGRLYPSDTQTAAVIWVGGVGGGWDTPARNLYPELAATLTGDGIASVRLKFRDPRDMVRSTEDVVAAIRYLRHEGYARLGLVGHSLGGAVVIRAASRVPEAVRTVVGLATQSYGAENAVRQLDPACSLLLLHGEADTVLPSRGAALLFQNAREPKEMVTYPQAGHTLDEVADAVHRKVHDWLRDRLIVNRT